MISGTPLLMKIVTLDRSTQHMPQLPPNANFSGRRSTNGRQGNEATHMNPLLAASYTSNYSKPYSPSALARSAPI